MYINGFLLPLYPLFLPLKECVWIRNKREKPKTGVYMVVSGLLEQIVYIFLILS